MKSHGWQQKINIFYNFVHRAFKYNNNLTGLNEEIQYIRVMAVENDYDINIIDKVIKKYKNKNRRMNLTEQMTKLQNIKEQDKVYVSQKYMNSWSEECSNSFVKSRINVSYKPFNKIAGFLPTVLRRVRTDWYDKQGIYKIKCSDCDFFYIGKTNRSFMKRFSEHFMAFMKKDVKNSNVADHLIRTGHRIVDCNSNLEILEICYDNNRLSQLEKYYIYKFRNDGNLINSQTEFENDKLYRMITK